MIFTQEQINEIKQRLAISGSKDPQLPIADLPLTGEETIALVQQGENKRVSIEEFYEEFSQYIDGSERVDFFNVSRYAQRIADAEASVILTLDEAVALCPDDVQRGGQVITFIDDKGNWTLWQFKGTTPESWSDTSSMWQNLESDPNLGIVFTISTNTLNVGETETVTLNIETIDQGKANVIEIYANNELFKTYKDTSKVIFTTEVSEETEFTIKATQYGYTYTEVQKIAMSYPAWIGSGENYTDVIKDNNKHIITETVDGSYSVTFDSTAYLFLIVPKVFVLGPITMSGFDVPMEAASTQTIGEVEYNVYMSSNQYIAGTHTFAVGTYSGSEKELVSSMQQDIGGLQTLMGEQEETNQQQNKNIEDLQEDVEKLQENGTNTADEEDITLEERKYKFADKKYDSENFSGLGRVYLRKNIQNISVTEGNVTTITRKNLLVQSMLSKANSIYIIQYAYDLNGGTVTIPENCVLKFEGGSISNGTIVGADTILVYYQGNILEDVVTEGTFVNKSSFSGSYNDLSDKPTIPSGSFLNSSSGPTSARPSMTEQDIGYLYFDTTLGKPTFFLGFSEAEEVWVDASGTSLTTTSNEPEE